MRSTTSGCAERSARIGPPLGIISLPRPRFCARNIFVQAAPPIPVQAFAPDLARRVGLILAALVALIARRFLREPRLALLIIPLCTRIHRAAPPPPLRAPDGGPRRRNSVQAPPIRRADFGVAPPRRPAPNNAPHRPRLA